MTANDTENGHEQQSAEHTETYPDSVPDEWARTLRVTVDSDKRTDEGGTDHPTISFPDVDAATAVFTESTLALLRALNTHEPASIRETARLVERDKKNVHDQLRKLAAYGVVEFIKEGNAKRPMAAYDTIVFDFAVSLTQSDEGGTDEPATA